MSEKKAASPDTYACARVANGSASVLSMVRYCHRCGEEVWVDAEFLEVAKSSKEICKEEES